MGEVVAFIFLVLLVFGLPYWLAKKLGHSQLSGWIKVFICLPVLAFIPQVRIAAGKQADTSVWLVMLMLFAFCVLTWRFHRGERSIVPWVWRRKLKRKQRAEAAFRAEQARQQAEFNRQQRMRDEAEYARKQQAYEQRAREAEQARQQEQRKRSQQRQQQEQQRSQQQTTTSSTAKDPYVILGVARTATPAEIKRAYRKLMMQYHPDKAASTTPEIQKLAEEKTKEIQWAYSQIGEREIR